MSERKKRLARRVRSTPGFQRVKETVLPRVQGSETAVDIATRVFGDLFRLGARVPLRTATHLRDPEALHWPVVVVTLDQVSAGDADRVVRDIQALQDRLRCFRPVFVIDRAEIGAIRELGQPFELLAAKTTFPDEAAWVAHRSRRIISMTDHYGAWLVMDADDDGLAERDLLLLEALPAYLADQDL
ncbi:hypothetical protein [Janibacter sp. GXQ6167]|uniref:hypothetical protein n=1 Tax=Janibacter sp. GXQ6167 TaxID=3240791 RepID=UPI0035249997